MLDVQLAAEREFMKKRAAIRAQIDSSISRVNAVKRQDGSMSGEDGAGSMKKPQQKVKHLLKDQGKEATKSVVDDYRDAFPKRDLFRSNTECHMREIPTVEKDVNKDSDDNELSGEPVVSCNCSSNPKEGTADGPGRSVRRISREQLAARKAVAQNLPKFRGEPEVWPLFISNFEYTTEACGFSNLENLKRLQDCLLGQSEVILCCRILFRMS